MKRRYLDAETRTHLVAAAVFGGLGLVLLLVFGSMWISDSKATIGDFAPVGIFGLGFILGPLAFAFAKRRYLEVDTSSGSAALIAKGKRRWTGRVDELGPVTLDRHVREGGSESRDGQWILYRVRSGGEARLIIHEASTYTRARRLAVSLAREWNVGLRTLDGQFHALTDLGEPLRLPEGKADRPALRPDSGVTVTANDGLATFKSARLSRPVPFPDLLLLGGTVMGVVALREIRQQTPNLLEAPLQEPGSLVLALGALAVAVGFGTAFVRQLRRVLRSSPDTISIDEHHIRYGGQSIALPEVREVTYADGIVVVSDDRDFAIDPGFCQTSSIPALIAELRARVIEGATRSRLNAQS